MSKECMFLLCLCACMLVWMLAMVCLYVCLCIPQTQDTAAHAPAEKMSSCLPLQMTLWLTGGENTTDNRQPVRTPDRAPGGPVNNTELSCASHRLYIRSTPCEGVGKSMGCVCVVVCVCGGVHVNICREHLLLVTACWRNRHQWSETLKETRPDLPVCLERQGGSQRGTETAVTVCLYLYLYSLSKGINQHETLWRLQSKRKESLSVSPGGEREALALQLYPSQGRPSVPTKHHRAGRGFIVFWVCFFSCRCGCVSYCCVRRCVSWTGVFVIGCKRMNPEVEKGYKTTTCCVY